MFALIAILLIALLFIYYYGTRNFNYWKDRCVKYVKPLPIVGTNFRLFTRQMSMTDLAVEMYWSYPGEKIVGMFASAGKPGLVIRDPQLIKQILVTDFAYFYPRGLNSHKTVIEPMLKNLFFADGDLWKLLRQRMTPAFTSGKLKAMFPLIVERAEKLQKIATGAANTEVDVRDLMARYTTDFIGACGFGIDADSLNDDTSTFRKLGKRIFTSTIRDTSIDFLKEIMPNLCKDLHIMPPEVENNTLALTKSIMQQRNYKPIGRNDFIDLLLELKEKGRIFVESIENRNPDGSSQEVSLELDDILMAAQVFVFFAAGFETSSSATSYTLHQLAFHPEAQQRCQDEIDEVLSRYDNTLCYDAIKEMKYLEMCFKEGMRMYPSLGFLIRQCAKEYTIPGTNVKIDKEVQIIIPVQALHHDEKYWERPEEFRPERFHSDVIGDIPKHVYMPFGEGPRACIGERLGLMQSLAGLAALLSKCSVSPSNNTLRKPVTDPTQNIVQSIKGGIPLALAPRTRS